MIDHNRALTEEEITDQLETLHGWSIDMGHLYREFEFPDFVHAFGFISSIALLAEKEGHHPEWSNMYGIVQVRLTSHDVQGISERDFALAHKIESLAYLR